MNNKTKKTVREFKTFVHRTQTGLYRKKHAVMFNALINTSITGTRYLYVQKMYIKTAVCVHTCRFVLKFTRLSTYQFL